MSQSASNIITLITGPFHSLKTLDTIGNCQRPVYMYERKKTPLSHKDMCLILRPQNSNFFLKNYATSDGAVSHNVFYYQPLPITRYQVRFYANNYVE